MFEVWRMFVTLRREQQILTYNSGNDVNSCPYLVNEERERERQGERAVVGPGSNLPGCLLHHIGVSVDRISLLDKDLWPFAMLVDTLLLDQLFVLVERFVMSARCQRLPQEEEQQDARAGTYQVPAPLLMRCTCMKDVRLQ
jgi:hypothetical protein